MNIYLVDDDTEDHEIFEMALEETTLAINFRSFYSGLDLLNHLNDESIHKSSQLLIFTDLNMPRMNGFELMTQMVKLNYLAKYQVVIYSTSSNSEHQQQAKELGASSYVIKPSDFQSLVNTLQEIIPRLAIVK